MAGKTVPWWRKALNFAMEGIRSRFGLFFRSTDPQPPADAAASIAPHERLKEDIDSEVIALTEEIQNPSPNAVLGAAEAEAAVPSEIPTPEPEMAGVAPEAVAAPLEEPLAASDLSPQAQEDEPSAPHPAKEPDLDPPAPPDQDPGPDPEPPAGDPEPAEPPVTEPEPDPDNAPAPVQGEKLQAADASAVAPEPEASAADSAPDENSVEPPPAAAAPAPAAAQEPPAPAVREPFKPRQQDTDADTFPISVFVGQVYDGPLDLLLDLIRKQDIDIYDIPIARITAQFLAYVDQLKATDVDVAGEFIYTASLLIHIKSKMLLPRAPSGPEEAAEDPRRELVERLLEHERFKNAAQMLQQKQMLESASWTNPGIREFKHDASAEPEIAADTTDLVRIFRDILERARKRPVFSMDEDQVTVGQMIQFLGRRLTMEDKPVALRKLLSHTRSERALIAMFLALLELVRLQAILLRQDRAFSDILIKKNTAFETVMTERVANAGDEWR